MQTEVMLVYNPQSGKRGRLYPKWEQDLAWLTKAHPGRNPKAMSLQAWCEEPLAHWPRLIMVYGGDGTLKSAVQKYCRNQSPAKTNAAFYFWGGGTGNDFLRQCVRLSLPQVMMLLDTKNVRFIDVGLVEFHDRESEYFLNSFNIGLGGEVAKLKAHKDQTKGYLQLILRALSSFKPQAMKVVLDQQRTLADEYLNFAILNGRYFGGGFLVNPTGQLMDGSLECLTFKKPPLLSIPWQLAAMRFGRHQQSPYFSRLKCHSCKFLSPSGPTPIDLDGELYIGQIANVSILPRVFPLLNALKISGQLSLNGLQNA